ncbi:MAG: cytochrome c [Phycisphaeraceae bacterium]|nr:cytochrome c [Phycisphaeraceae bacterium]
MRSRSIVLGGVMLAIIGAAVSCASDEGVDTAQNTGPERTIVLERPTVPAEQLNSRAGQDLGPLHNVLRVTDRMYSGNSPESDAAFAELQALGVKTIISVDGARPLVDRAAAYGIRYVHLPVGYDGIDTEKQVLLAKAYRDLPGPVYIHCHHGKHRGPAAAASAAVIVGDMTPHDGIAFLKAAKTSPNYPGLYECVSSISPEYRSFLEQVPPADQFPSVATVSGLVDNMVGIDFCFVNLEHVKKAGWQVPGDHPDIVPAAEAGRMADHYRVLMDDAECKGISTEFTALLKRSWEEARALEDAIVAKKDAATLGALFGAVEHSCKDCHDKYRNVKRAK